MPEDSGVLLLSVGVFTEEEKQLEDGKILADFSRRGPRLGGGTIGCDKPSLEEWHRAYYATLRSYLERDLFLGKDQNMMATTCLESNLCLLLNPDTGTGDWFRLQDWLIGNLPDEGYQRLDIQNGGRPQLSGVWSVRQSFII